MTQTLTDNHILRFSIKEDGVHFGNGKVFDSEMRAALDTYIVDYALAHQDIPLIYVDAGKNADLDAFDFFLDAMENFHGLEALQIYFNLKTPKQVSATADFITMQNARSVTVKTDFFAEKNSLDDFVNAVRNGDPQTHYSLVTTDGNHSLSDLLNFSTVKARTQVQATLSKWKASDIEHLASFLPHFRSVSSFRLHLKGGEDTPALLQGVSRVLDVSKTFPEFPLTLTFAHMPQYNIHEKARPTSAAKYDYAGRMAQFSKRFSK